MMTGVSPKMSKPAAASALSTSGDHASKRALGRDILRAVSFTKHSGAIEMRQTQHGVVERVAPLIKWRVAIGRVVVRLRATVCANTRGVVVRLRVTVCANARGVVVRLRAHTRPRFRGAV